MAKNNSEYWEKRIANHTWTTYNNLEERSRALLDLYNKAADDITNELYSIAQKVNKGEVLMRSDLHKFNRLKKLQKSYHDTMQELGAKVEGIGRTSMLEGGLEVYENIRTELGDFDFALPDARLMEEMIDRPWLGKNFSGRVWGNIKTLEKELNQTLVRGLTQGKTVTQVAFNLNGVMNKGFYKAYRLVRTETMHYLNESSKKAYEDAKCEYVELWAALDERTCPVCGMMHGNEYPIKDAPVLPLHANCRCTYLPVVDVKKHKKVTVENEAGKKVHVKSVGDVEDFTTLENYLKKRYNINIDKRVHDLNLALVKEFISGIEELAKDFPSALKQLKKIDVSSGDFFAQVSRTGKLTLNERVFKDEKLLRASIQMGIDSGQHVKNANIRGVGVHEATHLLEAAKIKETYTDVTERVEAWKSEVEAEKITRSAYEELIKDKDKNDVKSLNSLQSEISGYALWGWSETIAEGVEDCITNGGEAAELSQMILKLLKERWR